MNAKIIGIILLLIVLVIFAIQNTATVPIKFLIWGFETTSVISILASFLIGLVVGWLISWIGPRKEKSPTPPL